MFKFPRRAFIAGVVLCQVTAALQALPAQTTLADLIKAQTGAINTQGSIQANALGVATFAINTTGGNTVGAVAGTTGAVNDNQTVLGFIKTANDIANNNLSSVVSLQASAVSLQASANNLSASANQTLITMSDLLSTSNASLSQMIIQNGLILGADSFLQSIDNKLQLVINNLASIVTNTKATALAINGAAHVAGATGGWIVGPGTGTSDSIRARLSNGEAIIPAEYAARNRSLVDDLISGRTPPAMVAPIAFRGGSGNADNSALLARLDRLEKALGEGFRSVAKATVAGAVHVGERVDVVAGAQRDQARETAHRKVAA